MRSQIIWESVSGWCRDVFLTYYTDIFQCFGFSQALWGFGMLYFLLLSRKKNKDISHRRKNKRRRRRRMDKLAWEIVRRDKAVHANTIFNRKCQNIVKSTKPIIIAISTPLKERRKRKVAVAQYANYRKLNRLNVIYNISTLIYYLQPRILSKTNPILLKRGHISIIYN